MTALRSPGSLVTVAGASLTVFGAIAYAADQPGLNLLGFFYGIPVLIGGFALKSSELPPVPWMEPPTAETRALRSSAATEVQRKLVAELTRWRYGQAAHLEVSLQALRLWDEDAPPRVEGLREGVLAGAYALSLRIAPGRGGAAPWHERRERLERFFGPDLRVTVSDAEADRIDLLLLRC
ncbi:MAG: DUF2854 domain-containing protein [Aphanocapsa feldmannii 277cV]|uniref:DUF2854 domain-containing protein n=2 Tax=Aphanocapsa feldmannii TaxID=192050 RepID=A0A524RN29_9CHRO|nr:MAG: DUF2854 domain-containing protein [Aphanocapsa feldmannii 288cV]TGG92198.1 MAG: DUF2854 domain-containing protein [Aphanocapsa feldmannii 277cV]TGH20951.1 MAG: DUF2854 domain-containing protein [Aphanocapsa feldmannii 277cI]